MRSCPDTDIAPRREPTSWREYTILNFLKTMRAVPDLNKNFGGSTDSATVWH